MSDARVSNKPLSSEMPRGVMPGGAPGDRA